VKVQGRKKNIPYFLILSFHTCAYRQLGNVLRATMLLQNIDTGLHIYLYVFMQYEML